MAGKTRSARAATRVNSWRGPSACPGSHTSEAGADVSATPSLVAWRRLCAGGIRRQGRPLARSPPPAALRVLDCEFLPALRSAKKSMKKSAYVVVSYVVRQVGRLSPDRRWVNMGANREKPLGGG